MAEGVSVLQTRMRENLFIGDNGVDSIETSSQGSKDETIERDSGYVEDRFRVDRKKLEQMLQLGKFFLTFVFIINSSVDIKIKRVISPVASFISSLLTKIVCYQQVNTI